PLRLRRARAAHSGGASRTNDARWLGPGSPRAAPPRPERSLQPESRRPGVREPRHQGEAENARALPRPRGYRRPVGARSGARVRWWVPGPLDPSRHRGLGELAARGEPGAPVRPRRRALRPGPRARGPFARAEAAPRSVPA